MLALIGRIIAVLPLSITSLLGIIQSVIKLVKEILTLIVNILFPLFPDGGKFEKAIIKVRAFVDKFDSWFEKIKSVLLKLAGVV